VAVLALLALMPHQIILLLVVLVHQLQLLAQP
jgi:hypothetical protein